MTYTNTFYPEDFYCNGSDVDEQFFTTLLTPAERVLRDAMQGRYATRSTIDLFADGEDLDSQVVIDRLYAQRTQDEVVMLVLWSWSPGWDQLIEAKNDNDMSWYQLHKQGARWGIRGRIHPEVPNAERCRRLIRDNPYQFDIQHLHPRALPTPAVHLR